jgi:hypothetical protein
LKEKKNAREKKAGKIQESFLFEEGKFAVSFGDFLSFLDIFCGEFFIAEGKSFHYSKIDGQKIIFFQ